MKRKRTLTEADMTCTPASIASDQRRACKHFPSLKPFWRRIKKLDDGVLVELTFALPQHTQRDQCAAALVELEKVARYMAARGLEQICPPQTCHGPWGKLSEIAGLDESELAQYLERLSDSALDRLEAELVAMAERAAAASTASMPRPGPPNGAPTPAAAADNVIPLDNFRGKAWSGGVELGALPRYDIW